MRLKFLDNAMVLVTIILLALFAEWILFTTIYMVFNLEIRYWFVYALVTMLIFIPRKARK